MGDTVFVRNFGTGSRWLPGQIVEVTGPVSFRVLLGDGRRKKCHQDQLRSRVVDDGDPDTSRGDPDSGFPISGPSSSEELPPTPQNTESPEPRQPTDSPTSSADSNSNIRPTETTTRRYPQRERRPRNWFEPGTG